MKFNLHYKDEAFYEVEADTLEAATAQADQYWANRIPTVQAQEVNTQTKPNSRLESIRAYKTNKDALRQAAELQKQDRTKTLICCIQALKPRIQELLATANACLEGGIEINTYGRRHYPDYDSYEKGTFVTNGISHKVGFIENWSSYDHKPHVFTEMGIDNGGACGPYDFHTDGDRVYNVHENSKEVCAPSIHDMENFLSRFDTFEESFYSYIDKTIAHQKKSVDRMIASAQSRAEAAVNDSVKNRETQNKEH